MEKQINVVVIDQSPTFCKQIKAILSKNSTINEVATFTSFDKGINKITSDDPDVVLLDINMPKCDEKLPLEIILHKKSIPVLVIAENTVFQTAKTVQAMILGAVDFIKLDRKCESTLIEKEIELITKITNVNKGRSNNTRQSFRNIKDCQHEGNKEKGNKKMKNMEPIVVIGASTGGPRALQKVLQDLPKDFPAPILIVQHMPKEFTKSLAKRLNNNSKLQVKEAEHNEKVIKGTAYIAPGNYHMRVKKEEADLRIHITQEDERLGHRPSVNILFESVATIRNTYKIAIVLTGMGKDGAEGVELIKDFQAESVVIAESKETALINGMPNASIQTNCVTEILHLDEITQSLIDYTNKWGE